MISRYSSQFLRTIGMRKIVGSMRIRASSNGEVWNQFLYVRPTVTSPSMIICCQSTSRVFHIFRREFKLLYTIGNKKLFKIKIMRVKKFTEAKTQSIKNISQLFTKYTSRLLQKNALPAISQKLYLAKNWARIAVISKIVVIRPLSSKIDPSKTIALQVISDLAFGSSPRSLNTSHFVSHLVTAPLAPSFSCH